MTDFNHVYVTLTVIHFTVGNLTGVCDGATQNVASLTE